MANLNFINNSNLDKDNQYSTGEDFTKLFEESWATEKKEGTVVEGEVIGVERDVVIVDIGFKTEGRIPLKEFMVLGKIPEIKVGDKVEVFLEKSENRNGKALISREKALREEAWTLLEKSLNSSTKVEGTIFGKVKGGFTVDIGGVVAFLPGSQVDIRPIRDISPLMGISQPFQVLKIDRKQGNIVVSRRAILEESRIEARNELLSNIIEGQILEGIVKNITTYGAFVDLGSVDGLLHVTDISWSRISHPSEVLSLGQVIKVQVIKYNVETKRISLGMKQLENNPWEGIASRYPKGQKFVKKITNITDYGAFIELEPGIEGLVHVSEINWSKNNVHPKKLLTPGQEIEFMVLDIDSTKHRISLGIKQCSENPWELFANKYPINSIIEGEIKNIVDFGLFVGFEHDIDGLVHISDLSWEEDNIDELKKYKKDDKVTVIVLAVDVDKERISLGIKQLQTNPLDSVMKNIKKDEIVNCVITEVREDGIEVCPADGITGFIKKADLSNERDEQKTERFNVGDKIDAKILSVDKNNKRVNLSIKALEIDEHKKAMAEFTSTESSGSSLGDLLGAVLNIGEGK